MASVTEALNFEFYLTLIRSAPIVSIYLQFQYPHMATGYHVEQCSSLYTALRHDEVLLEACLLVQSPW